MEEKFEELLHYPGCLIRLLQFQSNFSKSNHSRTKALIEFLKCHVNAVCDAKTFLDGFTLNVNIVVTYPTINT